MKFVIENISKSSGRLGLWAQSETGTQLKTPLLLQTTKSGSVPFLSREVFEYVTNDVQMLQMSMATIDHMAESVKLFNGGLGAYVGFPTYPQLLMVRDPCELTPSGFNDKDVVPLFTRRGKEMLSAKKYMDMIEAFAPSIYQGLSDSDTNLESAKKRVQKSVDRTEKLMDYCIERHENSDLLRKSLLFVPIVGGYNTFARSQCIKHARATSEKSCGGYVFEGFHNNGLSATEVKATELLPVLAHCLKQLDVDKPKMMPGAYTPLLMLELVRLDIDMFDSTYAYCAAVNFKALTFHFDLSVELKCSIESPFLDLTDESLKEDFTPLLNNCNCLACRQHTRAYVHHLYKTKELLGPILLMIHNLHHFMKFFEAVRAAVAADNLAELIELIKHQATDKETDYRIYENTKVISKTGLGKGFVSADPI